MHEELKGRRRAMNSMEKRDRMKKGIESEKRE